MFRRVYGSRAIPRAAWGALHISTMAQANRLCPPLVPLGCVTAPAVAGAALMVPMAEALTFCTSAGASGGDIAGSALDDLLAPGAGCTTSVLKNAPCAGGCDVVSTVLSIRWCQYEPMFGGTSNSGCTSKLAQMQL